MLTCKKLNYLIFIWRKNKLQENKRKSFRLKIPETEQIKIDLISKGNLLFKGILLNISLDGIGIMLLENKLESIFTLKDIVILNFHLPSLGKILNVSTIQLINDHILGLEFNKLTKSEKNIIIKFVRENLTRYEAISNLKTSL